MLNLKQIKELKAFLSKPKKIAIVTHWSPDGDAMGSSLGLYHYLVRKKHKVTVVTPNDYPSFLHWMKGHKQVIDNKVNPTKAKTALQKADLIFCLDFNTLSRIDELGDIVKKAKAKKIMIDHHLQPDDFPDYLFHTTHISSTCELVFDFIHTLGDQKLINKDAANCLYTGIMTDTGSFRFPSTKAKTHRVIAELIDLGAENAFIHESIHDDKTEGRIKLLGYCLSEKLKIFPEYHAGLISLSKDELQRFNYQKGDTEGIVNYILAIKGIKMAAFVVERDGIIKLSFRSKGNFDVNKFARTHFNGGGHANAAGGQSEDSLDETVMRIVELLPEYKKALSK